MHFNQLVNNPRKLRSLCTNFKLQTVALGGHGFKTLWGLNSVCLESRDLKIRRRRRQRERHKSNSFNNHARVSRFSVHFFAVTARLRNFLPLSELGSWFLGIQLSKGLPTLILTKLVTWSNRDEDWKNANSHFQRSSPSSDLKVPSVSSCSGDSIKSLEHVSHLWYAFFWPVAVVVSKGAFCAWFVKRRLGYAYFTKIEIKNRNPSCRKVGLTCPLPRGINTCGLDVAVPWLTIGDPLKDMILNKGRNK